MLKRELEPSDLRSISYFYEAKGDVTRYVDWDAVKDDFRDKFPDIAFLLDRFEGTERALDRAMKQLDDVADRMKEDASSEV